MSYSLCLVVLQALLSSASVHVPVTENRHCQSSNNVCNIIKVDSDTAHIMEVVTFCVCPSGPMCPHSQTGNYTLGVGFEYWYSLCQPLEKLNLTKCCAGNYAVTWTKRTGDITNAKIDLKILCLCPSLNIKTAQELESRGRFYYRCGEALSKREITTLDTEENNTDPYQFDGSGGNFDDSED